MENVPSSIPESHRTARYHLSIARQLLADMDAIDYSDLTDRDLCRLVGRCEVVIANLVLARGR
ncbi:hypothetical protein AB0K47_19205 [Streptomyces tirandamycinicus]|uniref:hypothetical protein n=1 Tax=Streptomyces tirandamycinicus TaxID=2174846 RepID=UPI003417579F